MVQVHAHEVNMGKLRKRMSYSRIDEVLEMPNMIEVQKDSYQRFLDYDLREVLQDVSPITDYNGNLVLEFVDYTLEQPADPLEACRICKERDKTYSAPLKLFVRLKNKETGEIKESDVFMGDFPLMTETGTFIINGAERVVVSQLVRSPGAYFDSQHDKAGKLLYTSQIIPNRGAWLEYETDSNDIMWVHIDRARKLPLTVLLRALGYGTDAQIIDLLGNEDERVRATLEKGDGASTIEEGLIEIYKRQKPGEPASLESATTLFNNTFYDPKRYDLMRVGRYKYNKKLSIATRLIGQVADEDVVDPMTGEILAEAGKTISFDNAWAIQDAGINSVWLTCEDRRCKVVGNRFVHADVYLARVFPEIPELQDADGARKLTREAGINEMCYLEALDGIAQGLRDSGEEINAELLSRYLHENLTALMPKHIVPDDIVASVSYLLGLDYGVGTTDDIDHLGNRRVRSVGELLQNQIRIGMSRLDRVVRERMNTQDAVDVKPGDLINIRPVSAAIKEFFGSSQLSQFMDQPNPLAELTHKRRLSALGPGGLNRDRAGFDVRDVHYSHYSRICPIETPEGPNIGLIGSLASYAKINEYGFIEAPYRKVEHRDGVAYVTDEVRYMTADEEDFYRIATANEPLNEDGSFKNERVTVRERTEIIQVLSNKVDYIDVSPRQLISVATGFVPFLDHDDATRALMGSNMQRQAVPLLVPEAPIVGTGMEYRAGHDSGVCILAKESGVVHRVDGAHIVIKDEFGELHTYKLTKFARSNQSTCINQRPIVKEGQIIEKGDLLADGPSTEMGEIGLGRNALIGFMTWEGYNYEDAVLLSERLVREDIYTSIHIEEFECEARETKLGPEEITRDIPNIGDDAVKDLDDGGVIRIGAEVKAGDILVGKVTPKGETELTSEERLVRAIFGEKAREVRDTSLRVPHGEGGIVVDVKEFTRENKDEVAAGVNRMIRVYLAQKRKISVGDKMAGRHGNKGVVSRVMRVEDMPYLPDGTPLDIVLNPLGVPSRMNLGQVLEVHLGMAARTLGWHVATPDFDGAHYEDILDTIRLADEYDKEHGGHLPLRLDGKQTVRDGRTGNVFENPVTVGIMYFLKLHHLVDDKMHARSTGPYSLVTQQPLGGKAQFGGQRFGEMEVWALEAYGAANTLQEILTVKSDDTVGRVKTYEAIIKGQNVPVPGVPESFKVLVKELQALCLDVRVLDYDGMEIEIPELDPEDTMLPAPISLKARKEEEEEQAEETEPETREEIADLLSEETGEEDQQESKSDAKDDFDLGDDDLFNLGDDFDDTF